MYELCSNNDHVTDLQTPLSVKYYIKWLSSYIQFSRYFLPQTELWTSMERLKKIGQHHLWLIVSRSSRNSMNGQRTRRGPKTVVNTFLYWYKGLHISWIMHMRNICPSPNSMPHSLLLATLFAQDLYGHQKSIFEVCLVIFVQFLNIAGQFTL